MNNKITIEQSEQPEVDMDTLLRCYEYIKSTDLELEKPIISERTVLKIVAMACITAIIITFGVLSYIAGVFWLYMAIVGFLLFIMVMIRMGEY